MSAAYLEDAPPGCHRAAKEMSSADRKSVEWSAESACRFWIAVFIAVGVGARLLRYLLRFPLWGDESLLAVNFLDRGYADLMRPLDYHQVAPLLFLWLEHTSVRLLGYNEWSMRLLPMLCSVASVVLFHRLARQVVQGTALVLAVGIFAVTYSGIRYSAEVKPYGIDLTVSTLILLLTVCWWKRPAELRWLWVLTAVAPLALGVSFPAVFVAGGASLTIAAVLIRSGGWRGWLSWTLYNAVVAGSFLGWYWLGIRAQSQAELGVMTTGWSDAFPPHDSLVKLATWLVRAHASALLAVPTGGDNWGSTATLLLCLTAAAVLVRQSRYRLLLLCAGPFVFNLLAAALGRYPYGGHMRLAMHVVPIVSILAGIGGAALLERLVRRRQRNDSEAIRKVSPLTSGEGQGVRAWLRSLPEPHASCSNCPHPNPLPEGEGTICRSFSDSLSQASLTLRGGVAQHGYVNVRSWPFTIAVLLLLALATAATVRDFFLPGKNPQDIRNRQFAGWFWSGMEREHEVFCTDEGLPPELPSLPEAGRGHTMPQFRCNQQIYSPRHVEGKPCDLSRVSAKRPLVCVQYWSHFRPYDTAAFARWLDAMRRHYELVSTSQLPLLQDRDNDREPEPADRVEVYEFVPRR